MLNLTHTDTDHCDVLSPGNMSKLGNSAHPPSTLSDTRDTHDTRHQLAVARQEVRSIEVDVGRARLPLNLPSSLENEAGPIGSPPARRSGKNESDKRGDQNR
jgi:hypothetical protein